MHRRQEDGNEEREIRIKRKRGYGQTLETFPQMQRNL